MNFRSVNEGEKVQTPVTDKSKILILDTVEGKIDIDITDDVSQSSPCDTPFVKQEERIASELISSEIDQAKSSSKRQLPSAAERHALTRYDIWFDSSVIDDIESDAKDLNDALITEDEDSSLFSKALSSGEKQEWNAAMQKDIKSLLAYNTWKLVELVQSKRVVDCKSVYKKKDGSINTYEKILKFKLIAEGFI